MELWSQKIVSHSTLFQTFNSKLSVGREVISVSEYLASHLHDGSVCVANRGMFVFAG